MSRRLPLLLAALLALALALALWLRFAGPGGGEVAPEERWPLGRWHRFVDLEALGAVGDPELARVLSLPYLSGRAPAPERSGVTVFDPERTFPGLNLYTSGHAPEVLLMDMEGRPLHRWRYRYPRAFPGREEGDGTRYFRRAHLLPGGDLLALYQSGGLIRLDRDSKLLWALDSGVYNDLYVTADGRILTIVKEAKVLPEIRPGEPVLEDSLLVLTLDGEPLRRISLLEALAGSRFRDLIWPLPETEDIFHTNTVQLLEEDHGEGAWRSGNILLSLREIDTLAVLDPARERVVWARRGPWRAQHEPVLLPGGHLLLFDNRGNGGWSQVLEMERESGEVVWRWASDPPERLSSPEAGAAARLPNGNTLITVSERGRAIEVTPEGEIVWEYVSPHRAGPRRDLVATLFEVVRLPEESVAGWLPRRRRSSQPPPPPGPPPGR